MKRISMLAVTVLLLSASSPAAQRPGGSLSFGVTDERKVITRSINSVLLLRAVKESSVRQKHFGWSVEVVRKPYRRSSVNLLRSGAKVSGAHPSQVFAWHVGDATFNNERELEVRGHPYKVRIELIDPVAEGKELDRRFVSGQIKITWERK